MTRFDSVIIATEQPDVLADWYTTLVGAERTGDNVVELGALRLILFPHDQVSGSSQQPERLMINFAVDDAEAFAAHGDSRAVEWVRRFERELFGLVATIADPDGNYVQIVQHTAATPN